MRLGWYSDLTQVQRKTFLAAFGGLALDSMNTTIYALVTPTLIAVLGITRPEAGLLASVSLIGAAFGGWICGILADRVGRVRVLQLTILVVGLSTFAAAFANGFWYLAAARAVQGFGFGGEAAVGAVLVAEVAPAHLRGRVAAAVESGYAVGNAISTALLPLVFAATTPDIAWRAFFAIGFLPAACVFIVRRFVPESRLFVEARADAEVRARRGDRTAAEGADLWAIFRPPYRGRTFIATLFTTGTLGAAYVMITWLPTYVQSVLKLPLSETAGYLIVNILGSFCGPFVFGQIADRAGRRPAFMLFLALQAANVVAYTQAPIGLSTTLVLGFFLGAFQSGLASGLMPTFSELFPTGIRASGAGFALSAGRGFGSIVPPAVGLLSGAMPFGSAMMICAVSGYAVAFVAALLLPEVGGTDLAALGDAGAAPEDGDPAATRSPPGFPTIERSLTR